MSSEPKKPPVTNPANTTAFPVESKSGVAPSASRAFAANAATRQTSASDAHEPRKLAVGNTQAPSATRPRLVANAAKNAAPPTVPSR